MKLRRRTGCLLAAVAVGVGLVAWLGPGPLGWSLSACLRRAESGRAWQHVPEGTPVTAVFHLDRLLDSAVVRAMASRALDQDRRRGCF